MSKTLEIKKFSFHFQIHSLDFNFDSYLIQLNIFIYKYITLSIATLHGLSSPFHYIPSFFNQFPFHITGPILSFIDVPIDIAKM